MKKLAAIFLPLLFAASTAYAQGSNDPSRKSSSTDTVSSDTEEFLKELGGFIDSMEREKPGWLDEETKKSAAEQEAKRSTPTKTTTSSLSDEMARRRERSAAINKRLDALGELSRESGDATQLFISSAKGDRDAAIRNLKAAIEKADAAVSYGEKALRELADPADPNWPEKRNLIQQIVIAQKELGQTLREKLP